MISAMLRYKGKIFSRKSRDSEQGSVIARKREELFSFK
jgi:hypothetical protein